MIASSVFKRSRVERASRSKRVAAAVSTMVPPQRRASAYGIFNAAYGISWFLGSAVIGFLYDHSLPALIAFSVVAELAAIPFFLVVARHQAA